MVAPVETSFRTALPEDVEFAVPLIYSSGPAAFDYIFWDEKKGSAKDFLHYAFMRPGGEMGYTNHLAIIVDGSMVGIGAGWSGKRTFSFTWKIAIKILGFYGLVRSIGVMLRGIRFEQMVRPPIKKQFVLAHLGVQPNLRGRGIGRQLIEELIHRSGVDRPNKFILDVSDINPKAMALYERMGFKVTAHANSSLKRKKGELFNVCVPGHSRMELPSQQLID